MGFNVRQPGKVNRGDLFYLLAAIAVVVGLVVWALS